MQRLLSVICTGRSRLERVAAVTFTEKAASELRIRLRVEIDSVLAGSLPDEERRHLRAARLQLERASISTVHAFCSALLRERPLEAGVDPNFTVLDTFGTRVLQTETWQEWLAQEMEHGPNVVKTALRAGLSLKHFEALRDFLVEQRDCLPLLAEPVDSPLPTFRLLFQQLLARLVSLQPACSDKTDRAYAQIVRVQEQVEQIEQLQQPETGSNQGWERLLFQPWPVQRRAGNKANWKPTETLAEVRACFQDLADAHNQARAAWAHNQTLGLVQWLSGYLSAYDKKKQDQSCLDFTDLLLCMRNVLADNLEVRQYFQNKFDFLLIDEFQDTDPLQAEIVFFLAEREPQAKEWTEAVLKPGKLFLVGDPYQSIYRFRRADLAVYSLVRTALERQGAVIALSMNFRTRAPILNWINTTFDRAFGDIQEDVSEALVYRPLLAARQEAQGEQKEIEEPEEPEEIEGQAEDKNIQGQTGRYGPAILPLPIPKNLLPLKPARQDMRVAEAQTVAAFLRQAAADAAAHLWGELSEDGALNYRDIAVLFRTHRAMDAYEEAFRQAGIPYQVLGGRQYVSRSEIEELRVLLRTIESPSDNVALVATLRSSVCGFSDEELTAFVSSGGSFQYTTDTNESVPSALPSADRFRAAFCLLRGLHARSRQSSPAQLLYDIYNQTHLVPLFALHRHGAQRVANLLKLIDLAQALSAQGLRTLGAFNRFLAQHESVAQEGEAVIAEDYEPAVRFLTIHKAKGLEFPVVILADAVPSSGRSSPIGLIERTQHKSRLELQLGPSALSWTTHGWQETQAREKVRDTAEERRLWYVAATRVQNHLILPLVPDMSSLEETGKKSFWSIFNGGDPAWSQVLGEAQNGALALDGAQDVSDVSLVPPIQPVEPVPELEPGPLQLFTEIPTNETAFQVYQAWQDDQYTLREKGRNSRAVTEVTALLVETGDPAQARSPQATLRLGKAVHAALRKGWKTGERLLSQNLHDGMTAAEREDAEHMVRNILAAPSMARVRAAKKRFAEVPFSLHYKKPINGADCLLDGVIDFAFLEDNAWVILDFKTDAIPDEEIPLRAQRDRLQLGLYALALEELTAYPVKDLIILFARSSQDVCFTWNEDARSAAQAFLQAEQKK